MKDRWCGDSAVDFVSPWSCFHWRRSRGFEISDVGIQVHYGFRTGDVREVGGPFGAASEALECNRIRDRMDLFRGPFDPFECSVAALSRPVNRLKDGGDCVETFNR